MDTFGLLVIALAVALYFALRKSNPNSIPYIAFMGGLGVGIVGAAWWTVFVIMGGL